MTVRALLATSRDAGRRSNPALRRCNAYASSAPLWRPWRNTRPRPRATSAANPKPPRQQMFCNSNDCLTMLNLPSKKATSGKEATTGCRTPTYGDDPNRGFCSCPSTRPPKRRPISARRSRAASVARTTSTACTCWDKCASAEGEETRETASARSRHR